MECGLSPEQFWDYSWYELELVSKRHHYHMEQHWNHTRHIMAALTGEKPSKIMPLQLDNDRPIEKVENPEAVKARILEKYKHHITAA